MRASTLLVLTALVLLVVFVGFWKTVGYLLAGVMLFLLLFFAALLAGALLLRRRMRRKMAEFRQAFEKAQADALAQQRAQQMRSDAIDADFKPKE